MREVPVHAEWWRVSASGHPIFELGTEVQHCYLLGMFLHLCSYARGLNRLFHRENEDVSR